MTFSSAFAAISTFQQREGRWPTRAYVNRGVAFSLCGNIRSRAGQAITPRGERFAMDVVGVHEWYIDNSLADGIIRLETDDVREDHDVLPA